MLTSICTVIVIITISPQVFSRALFAKKKKRKINRRRRLHLQIPRILSCSPISPGYSGEILFDIIFLMLCYVSSDIIVRFRQSYQNNYLGKCTVTVHCEIFCRDAQLYIVHGFDFFLIYLWGHWRETNTAVHSKKFALVTVSLILNYVSIWIHVLLTKHQQNNRPACFTAKRSNRQRRAPKIRKLKHQSNIYICDGDNTGA